MKIKLLNLYHSFLVVVVLLCCPFRMYGADTNNTRLVSGFVNLNDSAGVYEALYENTPIEPVFKLVPRFAIVGNDNKFVFSVGASMKFTTSYDWNNPVSNPIGMGPGTIGGPLTSDNHLLQMSAGGSGIYFNIIGFPNTANETGLFISIGLDSDANNTYRMGAGQVYMRYRDFQLGYATSLYNDRYADAFTIDGAGPCASGAHTTVGMNWQHFFNNIRVGFGLEVPKAKYTQLDVSNLPNYDSQVTYELTSNQSAPNIPFYVGYNWGSGHVRLSSIVKAIHYVNLLTGNSHHSMSNGLKITGNADLGPVSLFWMGQIGWASSSTFQGNSSIGLDLVPDDSKPGVLQATRSWGFITAAQWNVTPKHFVTIQYSYLRNHVPYYSIAAITKYEDQMHYGQTFAINGIWRITSLFSTGIEYKFAGKCDMAGGILNNNRIYAMLQMNF